MARKDVSAKERSFLARVRNVLPELHPAERRLGEFLCDFPGELASYSGSELAELAQVSKATVSRFVKRLGYDSYEAARRHARAEKQTGSRLFLGSAAAEPVPTGIAAHLAQGIANLQATLQAISGEQLDDVTSSLLQARKVWVIGFRSSHAFASYLQWQLTQVIEQIVAIPGAGQTLGEHLVSLDPADVVIVFGLRRRVAATEQLLREVGRSGARLLYITDEGVAPLRSATWHFRCQCLAPGPLFNHAAVAAVCHLLASRAIDMADAAGRQRLRGIEALNDRLREL
jgi:DNA-binding MurR/RpiR family transcriptional regulator